METAIYTTLISVVGAGLISTFLVVAKMFGAQLTAIDTKIDKLDTKIDRLNSDLSEKINANRREIVNLSTRVTIIETKLDVATPRRPEAEPEPEP